MMAKSFYMWTIHEWIKDIYKEWGVNIKYFEDYIPKDFKNTYYALLKMHSIDFLYSEENPDILSVKFYKPKYVYEAISNLVPNNENLIFNIKTQVLDELIEDFEKLYVRRNINIKRIDLLTAITLFTEEFILEEISSKYVLINDVDKLMVESEHFIFTISVEEKVVNVIIEIIGVIKIVYKIIKE